MSNRPCNECIWHSDDGCSSWDCKPVKRVEIRRGLENKSAWERLWDEWARKEATA